MIFISYMHNINFSEQEDRIIVHVSDKLNRFTWGGFQIICYICDERYNKGTSILTYKLHYTLITEPNNDQVFEVGNIELIRYFWCRKQYFILSVTINWININITLKR